MQARKAVFWRGLVSLGMLAMAPVAFAQSADRAGTWETRLDIVYTNSSDWDFDGGTTADIDSDTSFLVGVGYHLNDNLELGGNFVFGQTDYEADIVGDGNNDQVPDSIFSDVGERGLELGGHQHRDRTPTDRLLVGSLVGLRLHDLPGHQVTRRLCLRLRCRRAL